MAVDFPQAENLLLFPPHPSGSACHLPIEGKAFAIFVCRQNRKHLDIISEKGIISKDG
jgi:hypothetical protein